ncbi:hypothetical protein FQZ97_1153270 [compost metagenome]
MPTSKASQSRLSVTRTTPGSTSSRYTVGCRPTPQATATKTGTLCSRLIRWRNSICVG